VTKQDLSADSDEVAFHYFEREVWTASAGPGMHRHVPAHARAKLPIRASQHAGWDRARDDFKGILALAFHRAVGLAPIDGRAAVADIGRASGHGHGPRADRIGSADGQ